MQSNKYSSLVMTDEINLLLVKKKTQFLAFGRQINIQLSNSVMMKLADDIKDIKL